MQLVSAACIEELRRKSKLLTVGKRYCPSSGITRARFSRNGFILLIAEVSFKPDRVIRRRVNFFYSLFIHLTSLN